MEKITAKAQAIVNDIAEKGKARKEISEWYANKLMGEIQSLYEIVDIEMERRGDSKVDKFIAEVKARLTPEQKAAVAAAAAETKAQETPAPAAPDLNTPQV